MPVPAGAQYDAFVAPARGMASLVAAIVASLPSATILLNTNVTRLICESDHRWRILTADGEQRMFDGAIIATPAHRATELVAPISDTLANLLQSIETTSTVVVGLGYRSDQLRQPLRSFGVVVPAVEKRDILAASFSSVKFPGRAPAGHALVRVFLGGFGRDEVLSYSDDRLLETAHRELSDLIQIDGEPVHWTCSRWPHAMPQYRLGHLRRVKEIEDLVAHEPGLEIAGNSYRGVGIPNVFRVARRPPTAWSTTSLRRSQSGEGRTSRSPLPTGGGSSPRGSLQRKRRIRLEESRFWRRLDGASGDDLASLALQASMLLSALHTNSQSPILVVLQQMMEFRQRKFGIARMQCRKLGMLVRGCNQFE